jgi:hypothetical protein
MNHKIILESHDYHIYGKISCVECNKYIKWANDIEKNVYSPNMTFKQLQDKVFMEYQKTDNMIYLAVPYAEKDIAKRLGARWDPSEKLWYTYIHDKRSTKLTKYMLEDDIKKLI